MMGIAESFLSLGWIVGPLVGGYAAQVAGFAAPFFLTAAVTFLTVPVLIFLMPGSKPRPLYCSQHVFSNPPIPCNLKYCAHCS